MAGISADAESGKRPAYYLNQPEAGQPVNYHSTRTAASKSPAISFAARSQAEIALFRPFCARTKGAGCLASGKGQLPAYRQTYLHGKYAAQPNPPKPAARLAANRIVHPLARRRAATAFFRREKGSKTRRSPAANGMRPAAPPTPPNRLSESPFLLMRPAYANQLFSADISVGTLPASAGLSSADRLQTECPINIALR